MRLPGQEHTSRPWRIHELTRDFRVEDVWALPAAGRREDFPRLVAQLAAADPTRGSSRASRALWVIRVKIGGMLGWDGPDAGPGRAAASWAGGSGVPGPPAGRCVAAHAGRPPGSPGGTAGEPHVTRPG